MAIKAITTDNFRDDVLKTRKPVLIKFWAPWYIPYTLITKIQSHHFITAIGRSIIHDNQFPIDIGLAEYRLNGARYYSLLIIKGNNY